MPRFPPSYSWRAPGLSVVTIFPADRTSRHARSPPSLHALSAPAPRDRDRTARLLSDAQVEAFVQIPSLGIQKCNFLEA